jgi:hypothetical protein
VSPAEQLAAWRTEIAAELAQLESELPPAREQLADAERQVVRLKADQTALEAAVARGEGPFTEGIDGAIWGRLRDARLVMEQQILGIRGALPARLKTLQERIAGRRLGLAQLDRALQPEPSRHVPEVVRRPVPPPASPYQLKVAGG